MFSSRFLNRLSWRTRFIATIWSFSRNLAWNTTPNEPLPITFESVYVISLVVPFSVPWVANTVTDLDGMVASLPAGEESTEKRKGTVRTVQKIVW